MVAYKREKRAKNDYCNICGRYSELTWDHVPPKSILFDGPSRIANTIFAGIPEEKSYMYSYQSGIKFRSICGVCNNRVLGSENDIAYGEFIHDLDQHLHKLIGLDAISITMPVKINRVCKAMTGHMLTARHSYESDPIQEKKMREYVLDEGKSNAGR